MIMDMLTEAVTAFVVRTSAGWRSESRLADSSDRKQQEEAVTSSAQLQSHAKNERPEFPGSMSLDVEGRGNARNTSSTHVLPEVHH